MGWGFSVVKNGFACAFWHKSISVGWFCLFACYFCIFGLVKSKMSGEGMACNEEILDESLDESALCQCERSVWMVICRACRGLWDGCRGNF